MEEESSQVRLKKDQEKKMSVLLQVKEEKDTLKVQKSQGRKEDKRPSLILNRAYSNNVFRHETAKVITYYLPAYLRLNFKKITTINISELDAEMSANILLSVYYGDLPAEYVDTVKNGMELEINREKAIVLCDTLLKQYTVKIKENPKKQCISYNLRAKLPLQLYCQDIFYSPFDTQQLELTVTLRTITTKDEGGKQVNFAFNLMQLPKPFLVSMFCMAEDNKGEFAVAPGIRSVQYLNTLSESKKEEQKLLKWQAEKRRKSILSDITDYVQKNRTQLLLELIDEKEEKGETKLKEVAHFQYARIHLDPLIPVIMQMVAWPGQTNSANRDRRALAIEQAFNASTIPQICS